MKKYPSNFNLPTGLCCCCLIVKAYQTKQLESLIVKNLWEIKCDKWSFVGSFSSIKISLQILPGGMEAETAKLRS